MVSKSNFGIGGNEVKQEAYEAILDIPENKTLIAQKLTGHAPLKPELVEGLQTVEQVFDHFNPKVMMSFEDAEGGVKTEDLKFRNLGDFGMKGITAQSEFLGDLEMERDQYRKIIKQLKTNKILRTALEDADAKKALIETIESLISELNQQ